MMRVAKMGFISEYNTIYNSTSFFKTSDVNKTKFLRPGPKPRPPEVNKDTERI